MTLAKTAPTPPTQPQAESAYRLLDNQVHARLADMSMGLSPISLALAQADWALHLAASPGRQLCLAQKAVSLGWQAWLAAVSPLPVEGATAETAPPETDHRFTDAGWNQWPFRAWREGFKATDAWWREAAQVEGMSRHHSQMVGFFSRQAVDAMSPSNWLLGNPQVLSEAWKSDGQTLLSGQRRWLQDVQAQTTAGPVSVSGHAPAPLPYEVGRDVAVTPGHVVFRNRLIELIRYTPTTDQVHPEPVLIVPSCIMKYYILDLSPHNSMVRYLVAQGFTVFIISWRNPDASDRELGMQDYLQLGVMDAMAAVGEGMGAPRIHAVGYCLGGTFLAIVAAALARQEREAGTAGAPRRRQSDLRRAEHLPVLASVVLLAAQTDFSEPGELGVFIDDDQLRTLRESMARTGYLTGQAMAGSFQFLNSRDLVWSRNTRRYLLGKDEVGNDMMSWNADVTRLPERMHNEYLSSLFLNNALAAGHYRVNGQGVALMDITAPMLVVGTARDHVSPWKSVYKIHLLTDTDSTFVLAAGGHNAGIVSEPGHAGRTYQMASVDRDHGWLDPEEWQARAPVYPGSWWDAMTKWLKARSGSPVPVRPIPEGSVLCDAPGEYVKVRYGD